MRGIRTFCVAAHHESFTLAASELFVTASAVSHQIKKLEAELSMALFERSGRAVRLTDAGSQFFEQVRDAVDVVDEAVARLRQDKVRVSVRISVQPFFASEFFVPHLAEFTGSNPHIDIQIDTSDASSEHHPRSADLSIRLFRQPPPELSAKLLFPLRLVPACSPTFREKLNVVGWHVSNALPMIVHSSRPDAWQRWSERSGIRLPHSGNIIRMDSMTAIARAAEQGVGAALIPLPLADSWFESGRLVRLFDYELVTKEGYYIVCRHEQCGRSELKLLRTWILQSFGSDA